MIYLGVFTIADTVFYGANFHDDQGALVDPSTPVARLRDPAGTWTDLTTPAKQDSVTGFYGGTVDTTGFVAGQYIIRMAGTVATAKPVGTVFSFQLGLPAVTLAAAQPATTHAALTITGALVVSNGIDVSASTTNRAGLAIAGNGTAPGMFVAGGSTGDGARFESGISGTGKVGFGVVGHGTSGVGFRATGTTDGPGIQATGGDDGPGILTTGGATSGSGLKALGGGGGVGIEAGGTGTGGHGISAYAGGGVSGHGISAVSGSGAAGSGINAASTSANGAGLSVLGNGGGQGLLATGGASGDGIRAISPTAGNGLSLEGIGGVDLVLSTPTTNLDDATLSAIGSLAVPPTVGAIADEVQTRTIARVTLVDTTTTNTDMRGTDGALTDKTGFALTSAYDAAKTAAQPGDEMDLVDAPNATAIIAIQNGLATVANIFAQAIEGSVTFLQSCRLWNSSAAGKIDGAATTTVHMRDLGDTKNRVTATVDVDGNRSAITLNVS